MIGFLFVYLDSKLAPVLTEYLRKLKPVPEPLRDDHLSYNLLRSVCGWYHVTCVILGGPRLICLTFSQIDTSCKVVMTLENDQVLERAFS